MLFSTLSVVRVKTYLLLSPSQTEEGKGRRGDEGRIFLGREGPGERERQWMYSGPFISIETVSV